MFQPQICRSPAFSHRTRRNAARVHPRQSHRLYGFLVTEPPVWRKKEAYIALGRFLHGEAPGECSLLTLISPRVLILSLVGYRQWDCFKFADYVSRRQLGETFVKRHLPLSNGFDFKNFGDKFKFDWKKHSWQRSRTTAKPDPDASVTSKPIKTPAVEQPAMIFDVDLGCLVPLL